MGGVNISNKPLAQIKNPIAAFERRFTFQKPITLLLKEKTFSWSGDDFNITDTNGQPYFKIKGKAFSMRQKKIFYDLYDQPIFNIKHELFSLRGRYKFFMKEGEQVAVNVDPVGFGNTRYQVTFINIFSGKKLILDLVCDFMGSICGIFLGNAEQGAPLICKIYKQYDSKLFFTGKNNYIVQISPNVDSALMLGLGVCFDEIKNDKK